ncbi:MAG: sulfate ABC transporter substrate-binding protein [Planctomycetaceae bacterium]|nr:sulfate ABC transporter substrate-binding protein [Planctomycetaceae bacterium]
MRRIFTIIVLVIGAIYGICVGGCGASSQKREILNVSYDPTRELYKAINAAFEQKWRREKEEKIEVKQSHGGSGKQSRSVITGNEADVVTLALGYDIDAIHENANLIPADWQKRLPNNSCPYTSTIVFLVRKENPKNIRDWEDLLKDDVTIVTPNPQTSGGARWNYLAAWGYILKKELGDFSALHDSAKANEVAAAQTKAFEFVKKLFNDQKSPAKATGARGSTQQFARNGEGDVLLTWENEALLFMKDGDDFEIITPSISILAEPPVTLVDENVEKKGTRDVAEAYLHFLYEPTAQEIIAKNFYRPTDSGVMARYTDQFKPTELFMIDDVFGGWNKAQKEHFSSGGTYERAIEK